MGKASRRKNRLSKSKAERKINRDIATKNHAYNFATCKSTNKIVRVNTTATALGKVSSRDWVSNADVAFRGYSNIHHTPPGAGGLFQILFDE